MAIETVIDGVLVPSSWNAKGEVVGVSLMTFDESEYPIDAKAAVAHGLSLRLRQHVRLLGLVRGRRVIDVRAVETLESEDRADWASLDD